MNRRIGDVVVGQEEEKSRVAEQSGPEMSQEEAHMGM